MAGKANKAQTIERVGVIYDMLCDAYSRREILEFARKKWDLSRAQIDNLIALANRQLEEEAQVHKKEHLVKAIRRFEKQYRKADKKNQIRNAIAAQAELNKLLRLDELSNGSGEDAEDTTNIIEAIDRTLDSWQDFEPEPDDDDEADECSNDD